MDYICYKVLLFTEHPSQKPWRETPERASLPPHPSVLDWLSWPPGWALHPRGAGWPHSWPWGAMAFHHGPFPGSTVQWKYEQSWSQSPGFSSWLCHLRTTWLGPVRWPLYCGYTEPQSQRGYPDILSHFWPHYVIFYIMSAETRTQGISIFQIYKGERPTVSKEACWGESWNSWFIHSEIFTECSICNSHQSVNIDNLCSHGIYILLGKQAVKKFTVITNYDKLRKTYPQWWDG